MELASSNMANYSYIVIAYTVAATYQLTTIAMYIHTDHIRARICLNYRLN